MIRFFLLFLMGPLVLGHYVLHGILAANKTVNDRTRLYSSLSHLALVLGIIFLPDSLATGGSGSIPSVFFYQYKNPPDSFSYIAYSGFIAWTIMTIVTVVSWIRQVKSGQQSP